MNPHFLAHKPIRFSPSRAVLLATAILWPLAATGVAEDLASQASPPAGEMADPNSTHSQAREEEPLELDSILLYDIEVPTVFSAARREERLDTVPYAMSVITAEDIRAAGVLHVPEALRLVPGVDVAALGLTNFAVSPRGLHSLANKQTLVLIDGRQIYDSLFGGTVWEAWNIPIDSIDRIEVIRGPAGATWGTNAANGLINIITKDPREQTGLTFIQQAGTRGFHREHLSYGWSDDKLGFNITGEYESNDGAVRGNSLLEPLDASNWSTRGSFRLAYQPNETDVWRFSGGHHSGQSRPYDNTNLFNSVTAYTRGSYLTAEWSRQVDQNNQININFYINEFGSASGDPGIEDAYQQIALQFNQTLKTKDKDQFTWGVDSRLDLFDGSNADPHITESDYIQSGIVSLYAQQDWELNEDWRLDIGGRVDYETYSSFDWSGRIALRYRIDEQSSIYGAISRAYQDAPAAERFIDLLRADPWVHFTIDADIPPASIWAYEIGYNIRPTEKLDINITPYWHEYDNLGTSGIAYPPPGLIHLKHRSNAEASLYGVEADARYAITPKLTLLGHYTYQDMAWRSSSNYLDSDYIRPPRHKFMTGARYSPLDDLHLSAHLYFTDKTSSMSAENPFRPLEIREYFRLDLRAEYEFWEDRAALAVGVQNLLDDHHTEGSSGFLNSAEIPRMVYAELRLSLP